jgi:hypothetical protein
MDPLAVAELRVIHPIAPDALVCPYCHQPILSSYYFCPNCGTKLNAASFSTSASAQTALYAFSIILPPMCFLFVTRWQGWKYYKSKDPKTRQIGLNAIVLLALSTVVTIWLAYTWTQDAIQASVASINQDFSSL